MPRNSLQRRSRLPDPPVVVRYGVAVLAVAVAVIPDLWLRTALDAEVPLRTDGAND